MEIRYSKVGSGISINSNIYIYIYFMALFATHEERNNETIKVEKPSNFEL